MSAKSILEHRLEEVRLQIADALAGGASDVSSLQLTEDQVELQLVRIALSETRRVGEITTISGQSMTRQQLIEREKELLNRVAARRRGSGIKAFQIAPNV